MIHRYPVLTSKKPSTGFSLMEVILAVGLLGFGIAVVMRLLSGSLDTLQSVRGANQALDLVPIINLKLENPSVNIPIVDEDGGQTMVGDAREDFQRRFFNKVFESIKDNGALQLLAYQYPTDLKKTDDSEHGYSLAVRFIPLKPVDPALRIFFPDNFDSIFEDNPAEIYRVVLSASSANSPEKLKTKVASRDEERDRGEVKVPDFVEYDIEGGRYGDGDKSIFVCQLNETLKADEHLFLALQVHIFLQSDNPARTNNNPSPQLWDRTFHVENRMFSYNTSMLAY